MQKYISTVAPFLTDRCQAMGHSYGFSGESIGVHILLGGPKGTNKTL